jgi:hypothetical protein
MKQHHPERNLPPEIWQRISRYIGPKEWARVAGTCCCTKHLQLDSIRINLWNFSDTLCNEGDSPAYVSQQKQLQCLTVQHCEFALEFSKQTVSIPNSGGDRYKTGRLTECSFDAAETYVLM